MPLSWLENDSDFVWEVSNEEIPTIISTEPFYLSKCKECEKNIECCFGLENYTCLLSPYDFNFVDKSLIEVEHVYYDKRKIYLFCIINECSNKTIIIDTNNTNDLKSLKVLLTEKNIDKFEFNINSLIGKYNLKLGWDKKLVLVA